MLPRSSLTSDQHLLARIYTEDRPWLLGRLYTQLRNIEDAEDVAGDTFVQLIQNPMLASAREPRALIITIAKRLIWKLWRRRELETAWFESLLDKGEQFAPTGLRTWPRIRWNASAKPLRQHAIRGSAKADCAIRL